MHNMVRFNSVLHSISVKHSAVVMENKDYHCTLLSSSLYPTLMYSRSIPHSYPLTLSHTHVLSLYPTLMSSHSIPHPCPLLYSILHFSSLHFFSFYHTQANLLLIPLLFTLSPSRLPFSHSSPVSSPVSSPLLSLHLS